MIFTLITIFVLLITYYYFFQPYLRYKIPPGPAPWPIIGNLYGLKQGPFKSYNVWAQKYGPIISVWLGSNLNVVVSSSDLARQVLKEHDEVLADRSRLRANANVSPNGIDLLWADYGPHYVKMRKMCTLELFSAKKIEELKPSREDEVSAMIHAIYNDLLIRSDKKLECNIELRKYMGNVALNVLKRVLYGKRFVNSNGELNEQGQEFKAISSDGKKLVKESLIYEYIPLLRWLLPENDHKFKTHQARIHRLTEAIMEEHNKARQESSSAKQHFVDTLLGLKDQCEIVNETVVGILWNLIIAGTDTPVIAVEWAMAELLKNPRVLRKAEEELDKVIGSERLMTEDDIVSLPYLQAIAKEALRLHPPTPLLIPHKAKTHVKIGGYDIPKGTTIHVNAWAIGRDLANWPDPLQFRPERFLESDVDFKGNDFRLLPFGSGRRHCIGTQLGIKLVTSMLGHLLHHFNWHLPNRVKPNEISMLESDSVFVSYMAIPLRAQPIPRLSSHLYK